MKSIILIVIFLLVLLSSYEGTNTDLLERITGTGEITIYQKSCRRKDLGNRQDVFKCEKSQLYTMAKNFRVDYSNQRVVETVFPIMRYDNCRVYNSKNWYCDYKDGMYVITIYMKNGQYDEYFPNETGQNLVVETIQIPLLLYRYLQLKEFF